MDLKRHPLLGYKALNDIVIYQRDKAITLQQFMADLIYLDEKIPPCHHLLNLYENRYYFLLGLFLGIRHQLIHLFPSNTSTYTLNYLENKYSKILVLNNTEIKTNKTDFIDIEKLLLTKNNTSLPEKKELNSKFENFFNHFHIDEENIVIFTSGSTGNPKPFTKKWSDFIAVARQLAKQLSIQNKPMVLATVPAQHMYGLETSIIMPLVNGLSIYDERPFYPEDISDILIKQSKPGLLITTPVHIRACLKTQVNLPFLQSSLSATAPLDCQMAKHFETMQKTSLFEVYGCTEVGVIATRRPSQEKNWSCLNDIQLKKSSDNEFYIKTSRSIHTFILNDHISEVNNNTFLLNGRKADIINLAGKRTSLSHLNYHLLKNDQVKDGCFYQPEAIDEPHQRLVVFVVIEKNKLTINELRSYLKSKIDFVFLPRQFYFISHLPRNKTGKIMYNDIKSLYHKLKKKVTNQVKLHQ